MPAYFRYAAFVLISTFYYAQAATTPGNAPTLPMTGTRIVNVSTEPQLQTAIGNLQAGDTIVIADGTYNLTSTLYINGKNNVTIRGNSGSANVVLAGNGMDNANFGNTEFGIWSNSGNTTIAHLTIRDTYDNTIILNPGANSARIYSCSLINSGSQFVKSNPITNPDGSVTGNTNGVLEYTIMAYTGNPPGDHGGNGGGYTNGISAHAAQNWIIRGNLFKNFHTPDTDTYLWNAAVLMWNHSANTIVEQNTFINVDRAVAFGLQQQATGFDHSGGVIRNNFVYLQPGLMSSARAAGSDGLIIVWDSPNSLVYHNTVLANGNEAYAIEFRFPQSSAGEARNNLADVGVHIRDSASATQSGNLATATPALFVNPSAGDLHLLATAAVAIDKAPTLSAVSNDIDGDARPQGAAYDIGADEFVAASSTPAISTASPLNAGAIGVAFVQAFSANGGTAPYTWSLSSGALPAGLSLSAAGTLSGTPTASGTYNFTIAVQDANAATATKVFALTIAGPGGTSGSTPTITSPPSAGGPVVVNVPVNFSVGATDPNGGSVTYVWNFGDGAIASGAAVVHTYSSPGSFTVTVTITTSTGGPTTATLPITVLAAGTPPPPPQTLSMTVVKLSGSANFKTAHHDAFKLSGVLPNLPAGLTAEGQVLILNVSGASASFTLDKNGHANTAQGTLTLKLKAKRAPKSKTSVFPGGDTPFTASLHNGTWAAAWNFDPNASLKTTLQMTAQIQFNGNTYAQTVTVAYTSKKSQGAKFKK